jgi:hypothetical protein
MQTLLYYGGAGGSFGGSRASGGESPPVVISLARSCPHGRNWIRCVFKQQVAYSKAHEAAQDYRDINGRGGLPLGFDCGQGGAFPPVS